MMGTSEFDKHLRRGRVGEGLIAKWLQRRHDCAILPVYDLEIETGKGPQIFTAQGDIVAPDMLIKRGDRLCFGEAKTKSCFTWHYTTSKWTTGIDLRHYEEYQRAGKRMGCPVYLFFLHLNSEPAPQDKSRCHGLSPTGLFAISLKYALQHESHRSDRWGSSGMVYWAHASLKLLAPVAEVVEAGKSLRARGI